ncbi:MAG: Hpt domain-containing protein [Acidobacteriota bacterium]|nr:Hpt domain-containing protein [Acidobacteriota bacterium]MDQ7088559.1 Hpt domain-containing protein [Acidobacteriota bacterium]
MSTDTTCPVDLEDGLARAGDDREFYKELLEIFLDDVPGRMEQLRAAIAAGQAEEVAGVAHSIKGAAANLSALAIRDTALSIETQGREGDLSQASALVEKLQDEIHRLAAYLRTFE